MIKCRACGGQRLTAIGLVSDTVGARCFDCGLGHIFTVTGMPDKEVDELVEQIFVDWDFETK